MKKRKIVLLAGLMTVGAVTFATDSENDVITPEKRTLSIFNINDRVRFDENRLEVNGNLHINEKNTLQLRIRQFNNVGNGMGGETGPGTGKGEAGESTEVRMRLYTQTSNENLLIRTELKLNTYASETAPGNRQYFRVQPTYYLYNNGESFSLVRAGLGYNHTTATGGDTSSAYSMTMSSENYYAINDYMALEGNLYYDYNFGGAGSEDYHNVDLEAYAYFQYPIYQADTFKIQALLEGGLDPYSFGDRHFDDLNSVSHDSGEGHENYVLYAEPSIKATQKFSDVNSAYLQAGYYIEQTSNNDKTGSTWSGKSDKYNDTMFVRVGFTSKF